MKMGKSFFWTFISAQQILWSNVVVLNLEYWSSHLKMSYQVEKQNFSVMGNCRREQRVFIMEKRLTILDLFTTQERFGFPAVRKGHVEV